MKDITLYGHLTIDTILDGVSEKKTLGSMANVWKSLIEISPEINIGLSPIDIGEALIYVDRITSRRYSKPVLNVRKINPNIIPSKVNHLIYLNEMSDKDFIRDLEGLVTADVCPGKPLDREYLKYVDYLFISDEDVEDIDELIYATKGWVILHGSDYSIIHNKKTSFMYNLPEDKILKDVNVLGAGDTFASCFLYKLLGEVGDIVDWIEFSHLKTTEIIRNSI